MFGDQVLRGTMIDTETLAIDQGAYVWEVAAVPFSIDLSGDEPEVVIGAGLHAVVDYENLPRSAFKLNAETVKWTNQQRKGDPIWDAWRRDQLAWGGDVSASSPELPEGVEKLGLAQIHKRIADLTCDGEPVWFRNSAFDVEKLGHVFSVAGEAGVPWARRQQSDIYTMCNVARQLYGYEDTRPAEANHHAKDDAIGQIAQLAEVAHVLRHGVTSPEREMAMDF